MPSITVKNLPGPLYSTLKHRAKRRHRSLNGEIIATLEETLLDHEKRDVEDLLNELEHFDARMKQIPVEDIERLRREGRP